MALHNFCARIVATEVLVVPLSVGEFGVPYRVYRVGSERRFVDIAIEIDGADDYDAIRKAMLVADGRNIELWEGSCCVARLSEKSSNAQPLAAAGLKRVRRKPKRHSPSVELSTAKSSLWRDSRRVYPKVTTVALRSLTILKPTPRKNPVVARYFLNLA